MHRYTLCLLFLLVSLAAGIVPAASFLRGVRTTYLPLIHTSIPPLPNESLILVQQNYDLVWINPSNTFRRQLTDEGNNQRAQVSPDGQSVLYYQENANSPSRHLLLPAVGGTPREVPLQGSPRTWSPDSDYIAYVAYNNQSYNLYTYHLSTGVTTVIDTNAQDVYGWHPQTGQIYFLPYTSEEDVSLYRSNSDGNERTLVLDTPDVEWMFLFIPDGRVVVSSYNPEHYLISSINPDGTDYSLIKVLPRRVIVVYTSPYGNGFFYNLDDVMHFDNFAGQAVTDFALPCDPPHEACFVSSTRWHNDGTELTFRWAQRTADYEYTYTLYTLDTMPNATPRAVDSGAIGNLAYSPDGRYLAYEKAPDLVIYDVVKREVIAVVPDTGLQMWRP